MSTSAHHGDSSTAVVLEPPVTGGGLMHICGATERRTHDCRRGNPECWALCGADIVDEEYLAGGPCPPDEQECVVCEDLDR